MNIEGAKDTGNKICSHDHGELTGCSLPRPEWVFSGFLYNPVAQPVEKTLRVVLNLKRVNQTPNSKTSSHSQSEERLDIPPTVLGGIYSGRWQQVSLAYIYVEHMEGG